MKRYIHQEKRNELDTKVDFREAVMAKKEVRVEALLHNLPDEQQVKGSKGSKWKNFVTMMMTHSNEVFWQS